MNERKQPREPMYLAN